MRHITLWKHGVLQAWDGAAPDGATLSAGDWREATGGQAEWEPDRRTLLDLSEEFLRRARGLDDAALSRTMVWYATGERQPLALRIARTVTHDMYHVGQIQYLRALQGVRRPE